MSARGSTQFETYHLSPFVNLPQIVRSELRRAGFPTLLAPGTLLAGRLITGQDLLEHTPLEAIQQSGARPIFVVHSADDQRISIEHAYQLEEAARRHSVNAEFWYIDTADHVRGPALFPAEYETKLVDFFSTNLR